ncbi:MAG: hypothetical protein HRU03_08755 [Nanoarchaeales archaeon]|nr:hypothetical protein [Nanoarchaeales archaeon]
MVANKQKCTVLFQKLVDESDKVIRGIKDAKTYLTKLKTSGQISSSLLDKEKSLFSLGKKSNLSETHRKLTLDIDSFIADLDGFLDLITGNASKSNTLFGRIDFEDIVLIGEFEKRCIEYNENERRMFNNILSKSHDIEILENRVFQAVGALNAQYDGMFNESAKMFSNYFIEFHSLIPSLEKEAIFNAFVSVVLYLEQYERTSQTLAQDWVSSFIKACSNINIPPSHRGVKFETEERGKIKSSMISFLNNFAGANFAKGNTVINMLNTFKEKLGIENSLKPTKTYASANDDDKLDKAFKDMLVSLFEGVKFKIGGEDDELIMKNLVKKIIKEKTTIKDLFKIFEIRVNDIITKVQGDKYDVINPYSGNTKLSELKIQIYTQTELISFTKLLDKYGNDSFMKLSDVVGGQINILLDKIKKEDKYYKQFLNWNEDIIEKRNGSTSDGENDELWEDAKKLDKNSIVSEFREVKSQIELILGGFSELIKETSNWENGKLVEHAKSGFVLNKSEIIDLLKILGKNLNEYKNKMSLSSDDFSNKEDTLKNLIKLWERCTEEEKVIDYNINSTSNFLTQL